MYSWISYLVLIRHQKFDILANNGEKVSKVKLFTKAIRKERATFFKGYLEKEYANRKAAINSNSGQGVELKSPNLIRKRTIETELDAYEKKDGKLENEDYRRRDGDSGEVRTGDCKETELEDLRGQERGNMTQDMMKDLNSETKIELETINEKMGVQRQDSLQSSESALISGGDKKEPDQKSFKFQNEWLLKDNNLESKLSSFPLDGEENIVPEKCGQSQKYREVSSNYDENVEEGSMEDNVTETASKEDGRLRIAVQEIGIANEALDIDEAENMRTVVLAYL